MTLTLDKTTARNDISHRWITRVVKLTGALLDDSKHFTPLEDFDEEERETVSGAIKLMDEVLLKVKHLITYLIDAETM